MEPLASGQTTQYTQVENDRSLASTCMHTYMNTHIMRERGEREKKKKKKEKKKEEQEKEEEEEEGNSRAMLDIIG